VSNWIGWFVRQQSLCVFAIAKDMRRNSDLISLDFDPCHTRQGKKVIARLRQGRLYCSLLRFAYADSSLHLSLDILDQHLCPEGRQFSVHEDNPWRCPLEICFPPIPSWIGSWIWVSASFQIFSGSSLGAISPRVYLTKPQFLVVKNSSWSVLVFGVFFVKFSTKLIIKSNRQCC